MAKRILLLEDDIALGETIFDILKSGGYVVEHITTGNEAIDYTYNNKYDMYIFDINVPDIDGLEILRSLREASDNTPTIFISAMTDLKTILKGFEVGACDFIKKPFYPQELMAKINLKFSQDDNMIKIKDLEYYPKEKKVIKDGKMLYLGDVGVEIFELFIKNIGRLISKDEIYEYMQNPTPNALRVHISNIKSTTQLDIQNVRGVGYIVQKS